MKAKRTFRGLLLASAGFALAAAAPELAFGASYLVAVGGAGACGGSVQCFNEDNKTLNPATSSDSLSSAYSSTLPDGSYANGSAYASFGTMKVYANAFYAGQTLDAQSRGFAEFDELIPGSSITSGNYNFTFAITGSHTPSDNIIGPGASASLNYTVTDATTNSGLGFGNWASTDAAPSTTIIRNISVPTGDSILLRVLFEADAYSSGTYFFSDYSHTLNVYIDPTTPGADVVGLSGHDYATPAATPLPAALPLFATGLGGLGLLGWRRKRKNAAALAAA